MTKKIVMITGATSGIGLGCARKFAQGGYDLIITGRKPDLLSQVGKELSEFGAEVKMLCFDVRNRAECAAAIESLDERWANVDVLINNAGLALGLDKEYEGSFDDWDIMIDTNIKGLLNKHYHWHKQHRQQQNQYLSHVRSRA